MRIRGWMLLVAMAGGLLGTDAMAQSSSASDETTDTSSQSASSGQVAPAICADCEPEDPPPDPTPANAATFVSQSVPTSLQTGQTATATIVMRNAGTATWTSATSYNLGSQNPRDNTTWGTGRVAVPSSIAPGQSATFTFSITAPATAGTYNFQWQMVRDGVAWFGGLSTNVAISVTAPPASTIKGNIDGINSSTAVVGWACSTYRNDPITVHMYVGGPAGSGTLIGAYSANLASETAVASACSAAGTNYRFSIPLTTAIRQQHAGKAIYIHGISPVGGSNLTITKSGTYTVPAMPPLPPPATTYSRTRTITYNDNTAKWVIGQVSQTAINGTVMSSTTYDANTAMPTAIYSFGKLQQTLTYNADGTLATVKDGNNNITRFSSWMRGIPRSITYADGKTESATVNDSGWIESVTDENGAGYTTSYTYDAMGRLASIAYPTGDTTAWNTTTQVFEPVASAEYGIAAGHWRQTVTTGNGKKVTYFDALWRPVVVREYDAGNVAATQRFQRFAYDEAGRVAFAAYPGTTDALTTGTWTEYDALGRVTSVSQDSEQGLLTTTTAYLTGFQTRVTDPKGNQTTTVFMAYDQPNTDWPVLIGHSQGAYTHISRDVFGKPTRIRRSNSSSPTGGTVALNRDYAYNANQELCRAVEPETGATLMGYDGAGNLKWSAAGLGSTQACETAGTSANVAPRRVDRTYDARNRLKTLVFPGGLGNQTWTYTPDGLPASVTAYNATGNTLPAVTNYSYNRRRLLTQETLVFSDGGVNWPYNYAYNANGHLANNNWHGLTIDYAPNALGQPTKVGTYASGVSYYPNGAVKQFTYGNGIVHTMTQNARQLPTRSLDCIVAGCTAAADKRLDLTYTFDKNANVSQIVDGIDGRQTRGMSYDGLDRLVQTTSSMFGTASYGYDVLDNLTQVNVGGGSKARNHYYCYDTSWRLGNVKTGSCAGATVIGLGYDVQGNLANKNGTTYSFDYGNRLRSVGGTANAYVYDGLGRRVSDAVNGVAKRSQYTQAGQLVMVGDNRAGKVIEYFYLAGSLVAWRERDVATNVYTVRYQHTDALGTPIAETDASKNFMNKYEYEPYGQQVNGTAKDGPGYTGHVQDAATGLTYMQQRYMEPALGVFLSVDPVTAYSNPVGMFHRYRYAANNPYKFTDPDGRCYTSTGECMTPEQFDKAWSGEAGRVLNAVGSPLGTVADAMNGNVDAKGIVFNFAASRVPGAKQIAGFSTKTGIGRRLWKVGDSIYAKVKDKMPSWSAVRARFWKNESAVEGAANKYGAENLDRMKKGLAPQRYNADKGGIESMELSHEPIPARDGGTNIVPRWPQDHAAVDPFRRPGY